jgi:hypothetical protein
MMFFGDGISLAETRTHLIRLQGAGAAAPLVDVGHGIVITRPAIGRILITWLENPGTFVSFGWGLRDTTQANVKGFNVTAGLYVPATFAIECDVWTAAQAAVDLTATNFLDLCIVFSGLQKP